MIDQPFYSPIVWLGSLSDEEFIRILNRWKHRERRRAYVREHGYSEKANYGAGGRRQEVLDRDGWACLSCGMTDEEHKALWGRPITIDHIDKDRTNNSLENLQTLCLTCHGRKDILPSLIVPRLIAYRETVLRMRSEGATYQAIADATGFSVGAVWKWAQRWQ